MEGASETARRVAAQRLFPRVEAPFGDPAADDAPHRDIGAGTPAEESPLSAYLRARTAFFDGAVVDGPAAHALVTARPS